MPHSSGWLYAFWLQVGSSLQSAFEDVSGNDVS